MVRTAIRRWVTSGLCATGGVLALLLVATPACHGRSRVAPPPATLQTVAPQAMMPQAMMPQAMMPQTVTRVPARAGDVLPAPHGSGRRPTLTEVRARVLEGANLDLAAEWIREEEARGRVRQAGLSPNPYVVFRKLFVEDFDFFGTGLTEVEIGQPFELGRKRQARVCEARAQALQVSAEVRAKAAATLLAAELDFYEVLRLQEDVVQAREEEQATRELASLAETRYETGKDSRFAALRLEAQARDAHLTLRDFERRQERACRSLDEILGLPSGTTEGVTGSWESATLSTFDERVARRALTHHPRRRAADRAATAACRGIDRADADAWPDLTVGLSGAHETASDRDTVGLRVHVPVPLRNRNEGARVEARARARRARKVVESETLKLETELDSAILAYRRSAENAAGYANEILPPLTTSLELARRAYDAGRTSYLDVLDALIALIRARRSRYGHLEEQARAAAEIRYLTGA